jgi:hypothetical protein
MTYLRDNSLGTAYLQSNQESVNLPTITSVSNLSVDSLVTINGDFTLPIVNVYVDGESYTAASETISVVTFNIGRIGKIGHRVNVTIEDSEGFSQSYGAESLQPPVGYSTLCFSVNDADLPDNSVFYGLGLGISSGDIAVYQATSNLGDTVTLDSRGVPQSFLGVGTHQVSLWFNTLSDGYQPSVENILNIVVVDNTPDVFSFTDVTNGSPDERYIGETTLTGLPDGVLIYITNGDVSVDGGITYSPHPEVKRVGINPRVRAYITTGPTSGDYSTLVTVNGVSDTFTVTVGEGNLVLPAVINNNLRLQDIL